MTENQALLEALGSIKKSIENLEKAVLGNGQPGLSQKVQDLEVNQGKVVGGGLVISGLLALWQFIHGFLHH